MTVLDASTNDSAANAERHHAVPAQRGLHVEPLIGLEWSEALEQPGGPPAATPADARRAWVHRAPEAQVIALYRAVVAADPALPAPWWLRAVASGELSSRREGFAVEDRVAKLLDARPGWVFVPWGVDGDSGYWEYMPSERTLAEPGMPTTLAHTHRHPGWIDVIGVHAGSPPDPVPVRGLPDLRANLSRLESLRPEQRPDGTLGG
ncbi:hypothetical protein CLV68_0768 [Actinokineospora cianjurensis]|uniref:Uncharacterized protein n=1 Tax=Actinokineospora cianjurensis TaxID=585224 RepID=A0A421B7C3_9PSEU|nr:hypothetical protein [Actinokineospora cianjurensis]RLK60267.1 hypothetical protein CLV68_0768 [Actinokineospora cianjurensis]